MKKSVVSFCAGIIAFTTIHSANAAAFSVGDLVVLQVGDGSAALSGSATAGFLNEYSIAGAPVQSLAIPTTVNGSQNALTFAGSSTSEGQLLLSANGQYLTFGGYNAAVGTATPNTASAATINRVVGIVGASGSVDTSTAINGGTSSNIRSAITSNGSDVWIAAAANGVGYTTAGTVGSVTQLSTSPANTRVLGISAGQLYVSSSSGTFLGVSSIGSGEPTTSGQTTTALPGFPTTGTHSAYDFFFANSTTIYVADDGTVANGGGIQKWTFSAGTWSLAYNVVTNAVRSFAVDLSGANPVFYAVSATNSIILATDSGSATVASLLIAGTANTAFRGISFAPSLAVPEPSTIALAAISGVAGLLAFRRRR